MSDEIRTDRLLLRRACWDDLEAMHKILSDAVAMRYWSTTPHASIDQTRAWLGSMIAPSADISDDFILTREGAVIGKLGAWRLPEIGFLLDPAHWGNGLASEALAAFIDWRRRRGSAELTADVDPRNRASIRLLERHGFVETGRATGTWTVGDEICDSIYFRLPL